MEEPLKNGLRQRAILGSSIVPPQRQAMLADLFKNPNGDILVALFF